MYTISSFGFALALTGFLLGGDASAETRSYRRWSMPASACAIESDGVSKASTSAAFGHVTFASGQSGDIRLACPVPGKFGSDPTGLSVVFTDTDQDTDNCFVEAYVRKGNLNGTGTPSLVGGFDGTTATGLAGSPYLNTGSGAFLESWNFDSYVYWVELILHKAPSSSCNVSVINTWLAIPEF